MLRLHWSCGLADSKATCPRELSIISGKLQSLSPQKKGRQAPSRKGILKLVHLNDYGDTVRLLGGDGGEDELTMAPPTMAPTPAFMYGDVDWRLKSPEAGFTNRGLPTNAQPVPETSHRLFEKVAPAPPLKSATLGEFIR